MERASGSMVEASGDFARLLRQAGIDPVTIDVAGEPASAAHAASAAHGTTVIAVKFTEGVLNIGDRRATSETFVLYDRADKILPLDDYTLLAVSGSYARAMDTVRLLRHSLSYYRRSQLQEMSLEGKLSEVTRLMAGNLANLGAMPGVILPLLSAYDLERDEGRVFFYDVAGARFESSEFGAAGSGSHRIRGAFDYIARTKGPFHEMPFEDALREALLLLDIAADLDAATGGYHKVPPTIKTVTRSGIRDIVGEELEELMGRLGQA